MSKTFPSPALIVLSFGMEGEKNGKISEGAASGRVVVISACLRGRRGGHG